MTALSIRKTRLVVEESTHVLGRTDDGGPLRRVAACAIVTNPLAGKGFVEDLSAIIDASEEIGRILGSMCQDAIGSDTAHSYGKAGIVGTNGEQEHVAAALTSVFGNAFRAELGGATAWISSTKKTAGAGTTIDVPLACKEDVWVRSHYDTVTVHFPDAPAPDEMVVIAAVANRGRILPRVGGPTRDEVLARQAAEQG